MAKVEPIEPINEEIILESLEDFAKLQDIKIEKFFVNTWNSFIYLRVPDASRRGKFEDGVIEKKYPRDTLKMRTVALALCNGKGEYLFPKMSMHDAITEKLGKLNSTAIEEICAKVSEMVRISQEDVDEAKKN